ncbi:hypothetical protein [Vibrio mediterranei]
MLQISNTVTLADWEIELNAIRSMGSGGQNVNNIYYILEPQRNPNA